MHESRVLSRHYRRKSARERAKQFEAEMVANGLSLSEAKEKIIVIQPTRIGWRGYRWIVYDKS